MPILWGVYDFQEIPRRSDTLANALALDYFARKNGVETIRNINLLPGQVPVPTGNEYTIRTRNELLDQPEKIFSAFRGNFMDVYDVLNHARQRNGSIIIMGTDGADCVKKATRAARMIFPQTYIAPDAIHFDLPKPRYIRSLSKQAEEISFNQAVSLMGGYYA